MPRALKYLKGEKITDVCAVVGEVMAGRYVIVWDKRTHPLWITAQPLISMIHGVRHGAFFYAIPNPDHPDNKITTEKAP